MVRREPVGCSMVLADDAGARLSNDELTALVSNANQLSDPHRQPASLAKRSGGILPYLRPQEVWQRDWDER